jgi:hypothetical protein
MASTAQININVNSGQATKSVNQLNEEIVKTAGSSASLKTELRKIVTELQTLEPGSARFKELSLRAGELRDQIADTNAVVGQLAGNFTERLTRGITGVVQIGVAGFQALSAAQVLFGKENEDVQQTLAQMTALLNLSQAIESFAGIDQKIVEIKASFQSLVAVQETQAAVTEVQAVATEGQAAAQSASNVATTAGTVATGGLTTATTALGVAMKALPIIGLVASLGALAYAGYEYFSSSKEAEKQEKKRVAQLEELKKEQDAFNSKLADETGTLLLLADRIKQTNSGTSERSALLKQLNSEYGINLQNIKDEKTLLTELGSATDAYIEYQKAKLLISQNQEKYNKILQEAVDVDKELQAARDAETKQLPDLNKQLNDYGDNMGAIRNRINELQNNTKRLQGEKDRLNNSLKNITKSTNNYQKTIDNLNGSIKTQAELDEEARKKQEAKEKAQRAYQDYLRKYAEILSSIRDMEQKAYDAETALLQLREQNGEDVVDLVERERDTRLAAVKKVYEETRKNIINTISDKKKENEELKKLDDAYIAYTKYEEQQKVERQKAINKQILEEQQNLYEQLKYTELDAFTDSAKRSTEKNIRDAELRIKQLDDEVKYNNLSLKEFEKNRLERLKILKEKIGEENYLFAFEQEKQLNEYIDTLTKQTEADGNYFLSRKVRGDGVIEYELKLTKEGLEKQSQLKGEDLEKFNNLRLKSEEDINREISDFQKTQEKEYTELKTQQLEEVKDATIETNQEIKDNTIETYQEIADKIAEIFNNVSSLISEFSQQNLDIALTQLEDTTKLQQEQLDNQLEAQLISREEYDNKVDQLNQQQQQKELQLKRKNFRTEKALNIVGATIDGARAVLSAFANTTGGIVIKSIAAGLAGIFAATQIALIARQEFRAAVGGIVPGNGSGEVDSVPAKLAPGEAVINSRSTDAFLPLLSAINEMGGGRSLMPDLPGTNSNQKFAPVFATNNQPQIVKAYVVESELSTVQKRVNRIERSISF